ncbi:MAG: Capsular polysaccharide type 8 biosynthesis protein cap8A [Firmicutes bacterium ADurb.Bin419]|nr:MAG: Capsular polysaccharide type 8 biosynthesis protein cap8A [Firmicutes bacterium ADurb.Bin419]
MQLELKQFFILLRKKLIFIILIPIIVSAITCVISTLLITPVYEASATLYVTNQKTNSEADLTYDEMLTNQQLVKDYKELIKSKLVLKTVVEELGMQDLTPAALSSKVNVYLKNNTRVLEIRVEDKDPIKCMEVSNKICEVFTKLSTDITKSNNINIVDRAEIPTKPIKPKPVLYMLLTLLLSTFATIGTFYLLELLNETIKTSEDIETYLGLSVLGTIPSFNLK